MELLTEVVQLAIHKRRHHRKPFLLEGVPYLFTDVFPNNEYGKGLCLMDRSCKVLAKGRREVTNKLYVLTNGKKEILTELQKYLSVSAPRY